MVTKLKIDIDVPFEQFRKYYVASWLSHLNWLSEKLGFNVLKIYVRQSTRGKTHIIVYIDKDIEDEDRLHLQYALGDDVGRYHLSLCRLVQIGKPLDKLFTKKLRYMNQESKQSSKQE